MLSINIAPVSEATLTQAAELLRAGQLVAFATETVYGLGADATNDRAVAEIFALKGRPEFNPLIVHVNDAGMAKRLVQWNEAAASLARAFWPGPLTLVLPRAKDSPVSLLASAGGDTLGVRMPAQDAARAMIEKAGVPVAAPSANRSGRVSPTSAKHVREEFADEVPLIIDAGPCRVGIESTVLDITGDKPVLLRPGFITREQLAEILGKDIADAGDSGTLRSPGMLESHYAPSLPVRMNVRQPYPDEAFIAFGSKLPQDCGTTINLSTDGDMVEAAANLFAALRALDKPDYTGIAVMPIPEEGIGIAINDRLRRAATAKT